MIKDNIKRIIGHKAYNVLIRIKRFKNSIWYYGKDFECSVCKSKLRRFLPGGLDVEVIRRLEIVGAGYFDNQMCPVCKAFNRDRLLSLFLKRKSDIFKKKIKLLHIAPEKGIQEILRKSDNVDHLSADLDSSLADIKMDITKIQFPDNSFDVIICNHVLEHIPDDVKAMSELSRVLKPDGWAVLQVPISYKIDKTYEDFSVTNPKEREKHFGQNDHVRVYAGDYFERLKTAGFTVHLIDTSEYLEKSELEKFAVIAEEKIFFCTNSGS